MTWELIVSFVFTIPAMIIAPLTIAYFLVRRYRVRLEHEKRARELGIPHIDSPYCKCYWCKLLKD